MFDLILSAATAAVPSLGGPAEIWAAIVKDFANISFAIGLHRLHSGVDDRHRVGW